MVAYNHCIMSAAEHVYCLSFLLCEFLVRSNKYDNLSFGK